MNQPTLPSQPGINDYNQFAELRHFRITHGQLRALRYVERPMMSAILKPYHLSKKRILMLGCGTGEESDFLRQFGAKDLTGIDISDASIAIARQSYPDCRFYVGNMLDLPFPDNSFDFIFSSLAITHVEDKDALLQELYRVLSPKGLFAFSAGHPMRFAAEAITYQNEAYRVIGFEKVNGRTLGSYMSYQKHLNQFRNGASVQPETLEEYIAPPSFYFEALTKHHFTVLDFKESRCTDECKAVDPAYYRRFKEIPQFIGYLAQKS